MTIEEVRDLQVKEKELLTEAPENDTLIKLTTDSIPCFVQNSMATTAKHLTKQGFEVIPLAERGKMPEKNRCWTNETYSPEDFKADSNIGIKTGTVHTFTTPNGDSIEHYFTVVDVDTSDKQKQKEIIKRLSGRLGKTLKVETGGNHQGIHIYFFTDENLQQKQVFNIGDGEQIEVFSNRKHYVVAPESTVNTRYKASAEVIPENITITAMGPLLGILRKYEIEQTSTPTTHTNKTPVKDKEERKDPKRVNNSTIYSYVVYPFTEGAATKNPQTVFTGGYIPLTCSLNLWRYLLDLQSTKIYNKPSGFKDFKKPFNCVIHKEKTPSAALYRRGDGAIIYRDFHNDKSFDVVQFYAYLKTGKLSIVSDADFMRYWSLELKKFIEEQNINTGFFEELREYLTGNDFSFLNENQTKILIALYETAKADLNKGQTEFIASARYIEERTGIKRNIVNRTMNQFLFLGFLGKGNKKNLKNGFTYRYSFVLEPIEDVKQRVKQLQDTGLWNWKNFSKRNVAKAFGKDIAEAIFRRKYSKKEAPEPVKEVEPTFIEKIKKAIPEDFHELIYKVPDFIRRYAFLRGEEYSLIHMRC